MPQKEIKQVTINGRLIGIVGLEEAIKEVAKLQKDLNDDEIQEKLLEIISLDNYIPAKMQDVYQKAILREYKIAQGLSVEEEKISGLRIAVLGAGCARCSQMESDVRDVLSEMGVAADLRHLSDFKEIAHYGLMGAPALVINDKVVCVGEVPPKNQIRQWIIESNKLARNR